jgi:Domain of Unknown Function (DUF1206)
MTTTTSNPTKQAGKAAVHQAKHAATNPWVERLERFGFIVRGLIYVIIGVLALQLAAGAGGATATPSSAIALIGRQPQGKLLLVLVAAGLAGYSLWGFVRAILDPLGRGSDTKGLLDRAGFLVSAVSYGLLLIPTVLTLMNKPSTSTAGSTAGVPASLMSGPYGKWLVVAFGLFWIIAGAGQLITAYVAHFMRDLKTSTMSAEEVKAATWLGRIGYAARGIVFGLIGVIILQTAFAAGAKQAQGFDGALAALLHAPYGEILLGAVAIGLILFGAYSALCAKWYKMGTRRAA